MKRIEKNFTDRQQRIYKELVKNNLDERNNYLKSFRKYLDEQKKINKIKEEKAFKRYESYVRTIIFYFKFLVFHQKSLE